MHLPDSIQDYNYEDTKYKKLYISNHKATVLRNVGIGFTIAGLISGSRGFYIISNNSGGTESESGEWVLGAGLVVLGVISASVGIPNLIIGQIQKSKTKKKMDNCINQNITLSAGMVKNGAGLILTF